MKLLLPILLRISMIVAAAGVGHAYMAGRYIFAAAFALLSILSLIYIIKTDYQQQFGNS